MLRVSFTLWKNARVLVLGQPPSAEGNARLGELSFCLWLLADFPLTPFGLPNMLF